MAKVLIIGASRGVGLETVNAALAAGHHVRAFARSVADISVANPELEKRQGDALNPTDIDAALENIDVVIQTLGVRMRDLIGPVNLFSSATRILVPAMDRRGVKRLIAITGFGAGESRGKINPLLLIPFRVFFGRAYDDKDEQERLIKDSKLDWTIVRPGLLTSRPGSGRYEVLAQPSQWRNGTISRADVARFLVTQVSERRYVHKAPVVIGT
jgi:putative NADH-flavin reductase